VDGFQRRAGRSLEDTIAGTLKIILKKDVKPKNITVRKKIMDEEGLLGRGGALRDNLKVDDLAAGSGSDYGNGHRGGDGVGVGAGVTGGTSVSVFIDLVILETPK